MYSIPIHKRINQITKLFFKLGFWSSGDEPTVKESRIKLFYLFYYFLFPISLLAGAFSSDNKDERILLINAAIMTIIVLAQLLYLIWRQKEILEILNRIGVYSIKSREEFALVNVKTNQFMKFVTMFMNSLFLCIVFLTLVVPFVGSEKKLFFNIGFPLDYNNSDFAYWMAFAFFATEAYLSAIVFLFPILMWFLMINCAFRYEVLGHQIKNVGTTQTVHETSNKRQISDIEKKDFYLQDLIAAIESHKYVKELINQVDSLLSNIFLIQIATSSLCICGAVYCLAFINSENFVEFLILLESLIYNVYNIFMVMYFGNEIKLSSDRLSYCLFESNWVDQPQSTKKKIIIFGELLRRPHELVILKLYPLTLQTFTRILNSAYNMFNILKNIK